MLSLPIQRLGDDDPYGVRNAVDFGLKSTTVDLDVYPAAAGTVIRVGSGGVCLVRVRHSDGIETEYYHLGKVYVSVGDNITPDDRLGTTDVAQDVPGGCGYGNTSHLHFSIYSGTTPIPIEGINIGGWKAYEYADNYTGYWVRQSDGARFEVYPAVKGWTNELLRKPSTPVVPDPPSAQCDLVPLVAMRSDLRTLTYSSIGNLHTDSPTTFSIRTLPKLDYDVRDLALVGDIGSGADRQLFVLALDTDDVLHRLRIGDPSGTNPKLLADTVLRDHFPYSKMAWDGGSKLFVTSGGALRMFGYEGGWDTPSNPRLIGGGGYWPKDLFSMAPNSVSWTTTGGAMKETRISPYRDEDGHIKWDTSTFTLRASGWDDTSITTPGAGIYLRVTPDKLLRRHMDADPTNRSGEDISVHKTLATSRYVTLMTTRPGSCSMSG